MIKKTIKMSTEQYAKEILCKHTKAGTASQQYVRRLLNKLDIPNSKLPQIVSVEKIAGYHILEVAV